MTSISAFGCVPWTSSLLWFVLNMRYIRCHTQANYQVTADNAQYLVQQLLSHLVKPDANETLPSAADSLACNMEQNFSEGETASAPPPPALTPAYRLEVTNRILDMCSRDLYANVYDFEWYLSVLVDLVYIADVDIGPRIRDQLVDVVVRVKDARKYAVKLMIKLLCDDQFLSKAKEKKQCLDALWAAAFLCGEYCRFVWDVTLFRSELTS